MLAVVLSIALFGLLSRVSGQCTQPALPSFNDATYYASAYNVESNAAQLRSTLTDIITKNFKTYTYSCMWTVLEYADVDPANSSNVILIYSQNSYPKSERDTGTEIEAWNREHTWPKSHGFPSESTYPYNDAHHLRPADKRVNNLRSDKDFDDGGNFFCAYPYGSSSSSCEVPGYSSSTTFEVPDGNKGDVARMMFYLDVRYEGQSTKEPDLTLVNHDTFRNSEPELGFLCTLYEWHKQDPVSSWEVRRNERTFHWHYNRNPFIDHPEWADTIFGAAC